MAVKIPNKKKADPETLSVCSKCQKTTIHSILDGEGNTPSEVLCRTCGITQKYVKPIALVQTTVRRKKVKKEERWEQLLKPVSSKAKIPYSLAGRYKGNDLIEHPTFGVGVVVEILSKEKFVVVFKEGEKMLASGRISL